ncbi:hypothetical protein GS934_07630 [Rhodococcus hoagii]|nr:hypothetical protein [Prescottella equi]NKZ87441.1 hypothetical protein [Prescottella equi]
MTVSEVDFDEVFSKFDIQVSVMESIDDAGTAGGLTVELTYATDLFEAATMAEFRDASGPDPVRSAGGSVGCRGRCRAVGRRRAVSGRRGLERDRPSGRRHDAAGVVRGAGVPDPGRDGGRCARASR